MSVKENTRNNRDTAVDTCDGFCKSSERLANFFLKNANNKKRAFYISFQYVINRTIAGPKRAVHHRRWLCEAYGWRNSNGAMQPWRGRYVHISPSFTCPLNKVNRTNSHWRYWYTSKSPTNHLGKPSSWHLDLLRCRQIQKNNKFEQYCRKSWRRDLQISGTVSFTIRVIQHICFQFKGKRSCWNILTKGTLFQFIKEFTKITDAKYCVSPSLREVVAITPANCTEVKLICTMLIL